MFDLELVENNTDPNIIPNEVQCEQLSDEWFKVRTGRITGSKFEKIMKTPRQKEEWSKGQLDYLRGVASEIMTGEKPETFTSKAMERGTIVEEEARNFYEMENMITVRKCGIFTHKDFAGSSPDGIIGDNSATWECKSPDSKQHMKYLLDPESLYLEYKWQVIGEMFCTGIRKGVIVSFDPRFKDEKKKMVCYWPKPTLEEFIELENRLNAANLLIQSWIK